MDKTTFSSYFRVTNLASFSSVHWIGWPVNRSTVFGQPVNFAVIWFRSVGQFCNVFGQFCNVVIPVGRSTLHLRL